MTKPVEEAVAKASGTAIEHEAFYRAFGDAMGTARKKTKRTQADLAQQIGLARPAVVNIEIGRQGVLLHAAVNIANALDVSLESLLEHAQKAARAEEIALLEQRLKELKGARQK